MYVDNGYFETVHLSNFLRNLIHSIKIVKYAHGRKYLKDFDWSFKQF